MVYRGCRFWNRRKLLHRAISRVHWEEDSCEDSYEEADANEPDNLIESIDHRAQSYVTGSGVHYQCEVGISWQSVSESAPASP